MGHSLGGLITGKALLNSELQSQFNGWINVDGVFDMPSVYAWRFEMLNDVADEQISMGNSVAQWESIEERLNEIDHDDDEAYSKVFNLIVEAYDLVNKDSQVNSTTSAERIYQTVFKNNPLTWQISHLFHKPEVTARVEEYSILEQMYEISIPSLFTYGRYDFSVPPDSGRVAFNRLSTHNKVFSIYQRTTHHPFVTESSLFTQELREFIEAYR